MRSSMPAQKYLYEKFGAINPYLPQWWDWDVMHWNGRDEYIHETAFTFEDTARLAGISGAKVLYWQRQMASLGVDCVTRFNAELEGRTFSYAEVRYFPAIRPYGFLYGDSAVSHRALLLWTQQAPIQGCVMNELKNGWFYFEGLCPSSDLPFKVTR